MHKHGFYGLYGRMMLSRGSMEQMFDEEIKCNSRAYSIAKYKHITYMASLIIIGHIVCIHF